MFSLYDTSAQLEVGMRAPEWIFQNANGNNITMELS